MGHPKNYPPVKHSNGGNPSFSCISMELLMGKTHRKTIGNPYKWRFYWENHGEVSRVPP